MASDYGEETYPLYRLKFSRYDDDNTDVDYEGSILLAIETDEGDDSDTSETYSDDWKIMSSIWAFILGMLLIILIFIVFYLLARVNDGVQTAYTSTVCSL